MFKPKKLPARFMIGLQYVPKTGLISDYLNGIDGVYFAYRDVVAEPSTPMRDRVALSILNLRTYQTYLEAQIDNYNKSIEKPLDTSLQYIRKQFDQCLEVGYLKEDRTLGFEDVVKVLYNKRAQDVNREIREIKKLVHNTQSITIVRPFEEINHEEIGDRIAQIIALYELPAEKSLKSNINAIREWQRRPLPALDFTAD